MGCVRKMTGRTFEARKARVVVMLMGTQTLRGDRVGFGQGRLESTRRTFFISDVHLFLCIFTPVP
jgi:hypothetical protein